MFYEVLNVLSGLIFYSDHLLTNLFRGVIKEILHDESFIDFRTSRLKQQVTAYKGLCSDAIG